MFKQNKSLLSILSIYVASIAFTLLLFLLPNQSNFNSSFIIPFIVVFLIKYLFGDFDIGFQWTIYDILFWFSIPLLSHFIVVLLLPVNTI